MNIFEKILTRKEFIKSPPVLVDIGASGNVNSKWKAVSKYSVCFAFEPDTRDFNYEERATADYRKLVLINRMADIEDERTKSFYLTEFPPCSSHLKPENSKLKEWEFGDLFKVKKKIKIKTIRIKTALEKYDLKQIDWFKTDSQGMDLRLFKSLGRKICEKVLICEFEPGFINAYRNEDRLYSVLSFMDKLGFWLSDINVKRVSKINSALIKKQLELLPLKVIGKTHKRSPGWAELTYLNSLENRDYSCRELLLLYLFSIIEKQYGFSVLLAKEGQKKFRDPVFTELENYSLARIKKNSLFFPFLLLKNRLVSVKNVFSALL